MRWIALLLLTVAAACARRPAPVSACIYHPETGVPVGPPRTVAIAGASGQLELRTVDHHDRPYAAFLTLTRVGASDTLWRGRSDSTGAWVRASPVSEGEYQLSVRAFMMRPQLVMLRMPADSGLRVEVALGPSAACLHGDLVPGARGSER